MKTYTVKDIERFWTKVGVAGKGAYYTGLPEYKDECWEWQGARSNGYGVFYCFGRIYAHRFSFWIHTGVHPGDLGCCHSCDNPSCVNPAHLWLGTQAQNIHDAVSKGRMARGEKQGFSKLTEAQVLKIRKRYAAGSVTQKRLAKDYGIDRSTVGYIVRRDCWTHI